MEVGPFIKLHRIEQKMTQEELAEGIVSMSYLSKIENQRTTASPEVISMLSTRLGIQFNDRENVRMKEKYHDWFQLLFEVNDKTKIMAAHDDIQEQLQKMNSSGSVMFEIYKIRYYLILGKTKEALQQINTLNEISDTFDHIHEFYWFKFYGNFHTTQNDFIQAMRMYKQAESKLNHLDLTEEDVSDLQYTIAVTHSKLRNTLEVIEYANLALETFMKKYHFIRCAECHIILGISYRRIRMYDKAIKNYHLAKRLGTLNDNDHIIKLANQNLGYLYSTKGDKQEAIKNYIEVAKDEKGDLTARLAAITSLTKEYYSISDIEQTEKMIVKGIELLKGDKNNQKYPLYYYTIYTYKYALEKDNELFESHVIDEFIPYLNKHKDYANLAVYNRMLGNHYEELKRYKKSVHYYKQANLAYEELTNI